MPAILLLPPPHLFDRCGVSEMDRDLAPFFGDLNKSEKLSEIRPHLASSRKQLILFLLQFIQQ